LVLCIAEATAGADPTAPVDGAIVGYSSGDFTSLVGDGLVEYVRREFPGSSLTYKPGNPAGGIAEITASRRPSALVSPIEAALALSGKPPFRKKYSEQQAYAVAPVVSGPHFQFDARGALLENYGIDGFKDRAKKTPPLRVSTNTKNNLSSQQVALEILSPPCAERP
jgi:uncharacterized protein